MTAVHHAFSVLDASQRADRERWLQLLDASAEQSVFCHPSYLSLFCGDGERPLCALFEHGDGRVMYPIIVRPIPTRVSGDEPRFDVVGPPFGWGGPLVVGDKTELTRRFFDAYATWARAQRIVAEYMTFPPLDDTAWPYPGDVIERLPIVARDLAMTEEALFMDYKGSVRTDIRRAQSLGITVEADLEGHHVSDFLAVYSATMDRRDAPALYRIDETFCRRLAQALPGHHAYFHARENGRVVSSELVLLSGDTTFFFRGGTYGDRLTTRANLLLKHEIILWSMRSGRKHYYLGAGNGGEDALFKYKRSFAPRGVRMLRVGKWTVDHDAYAALVDARRAHEMAQGADWCPQPGYFPAYRAGNTT